MYARYVPPKKASSSGANHAASRDPPRSQGSSFPPPAPLPPMPQPRKIVFDDDDDTPAPSFMPALLSTVDDDTGDQKQENSESRQDQADANGNEPAAKRKRKRKHKRAHTENEEGQDIKAAPETRIEQEAGEEEKKRKEEEKKEKGEEKEEEEKKEAGEEENEKQEDKQEKKKKKKKKKKVKKTEKTEDETQPKDTAEPVSNHEADENTNATPPDEDTVMTTPPPEAPEPEELSFRHKALLLKKEKSLKAAQNLKMAASQSDDQADHHPVELHGLQPLPQPAPVAHGPVKLAYETLPPWLANPVRVSSNTRAPFSSLGESPEYGIDAQAEKVLRGHGWVDAFAVQTAVIPMLLPTRNRRTDLVINAATGSGKTLAYVLPMVRDLSRNHRTRLRALIVVPTRELVQQVRDVCETCARAYTASPEGRRVRVGVSMGSQSFKKEQANLMDQEETYDPTSYQDMLELIRQFPSKKALPTASTSGRLTNPASLPTPGHIVEPVSSVDILVCTPGRLVEHIQSTPGFTLDFVRWLIVDEADKLLGQSYQQWLEVVMAKLHPTTTPTDASYRESRLGARNFSDSREFGVRKVILSATMTRDLGLLNSLRLSRPRLVVLEGTPHEVQADGGGGGGGGESSANNDGNRDGQAEFVLPERLRESAVKVRDESQKPLYLVDLLSSQLGIASESDTSSSGSDNDNDNDSDDSDDRDDSDDNGDGDDDDGSSQQAKSATPASHPSGGALVFTRSNENALRLSRLLALLAPPLARQVGTITSTTRTSERRKTLHAFAAGRLRVVVATDLAARGIDVAGINHVINYDMPPSVQVYVHRVGRTARAGRPGHAWTLFTKKEAGWFWPELAGHGVNRNTGRSCVIQRAHKVATVEVSRRVGRDGQDMQDMQDVQDVQDAQDAPDGRRGDFDEARIEAYEAALAQLGTEAAGERK